MGGPPELTGDVADGPGTAPADGDDHPHLHLAEQLAAETAIGLGRRAAILRVVALAICVVIAIVVAARSGLSSDDIRSWFDGLGLAGPLLFIVVSALLTLCVFPGPLLAGAAGLSFGWALGFPIALASATLGASLAFLVSRFVAHDAVERLQGERLARMRGWIGGRGFRSVLAARLVPGVPYGLVNYAAGATPVTLVAFVAATAIGTSPRALAYSILGGEWGNWSSTRALIALAIVIATGVAGLAIAVRTGYRRLPRRRARAGAVERP